MAAPTQRSSGRNGLPERPLSVEQIVDHAGKPFFDPQFSVRNWFRTADSMVKQANVYEHESNEQVAYFLLYRHASLILDELPKHPDAKHPEYRKYWSEARKAVNKSLAKLEVLKPKINKRYLKHEERKKQAVATAAATTAEQASDGGRPMNKEKVDTAKASEEYNAAVAAHPDAEYDMLSALDVDANALDPSHYKDIAVELANEEVKRRTGNAERPKARARGTGEDWDISRSLMQARRQIDLNATGQSSLPKATLSSAKPYQYPAIPQPHKALSASRPSASSPISAPSPPPKPPKPSSHAESNLPSAATGNSAFSDLRQLYPQEQTYHAQTSPNAEFPPPLPRKEVEFPFTTSSPAPAPPALPAKRAASPAPVELEGEGELPASAARQFFSSARLEDGTPLRTIFLPSPLRHEFVRLAAHNTALNLETCGILCGVLLRNAFFITKLVIPEQTATSDTCEMVNEEALYAYCDAQPEDLLVLGWIHTHPTQTCFMSSRDLHTHCWYQVSLPESIAIVCAPSKQPDWGIFRLTDPPGVQAIKNCRLPGIFHPHAETRLFTDALGRPGHVIDHQDLQFDVVDLRANK